MKTQFFYTKLFITGLLLFSLQLLSYAQSKPQTNIKQKVYTCPMHPEVVQTKPGKCPKCGMSLELQKESEKVVPRDRTKINKKVVDTASVKHHKHLEHDTSHIEEMKPDSLKKMMNK